MTQNSDESYTLSFIFSTNAPTQKQKKLQKITNYQPYSNEKAITISKIPRAK